MPTHRSHVSTIALTLLSTFVVVMIVYILFRYFQTNTMPVLPYETEPITNVVDPGRAFIRLVSATSPVIGGQNLTITLDTNDWAVCAVDVYRPDESSLVLTKEASKPQEIAPGHFSWTWTVPSNEVKGTWNARFLCGTADNLATVDQPFEVR